MRSKWMGGVGLAVLGGGLLGPAWSEAAAITTTYAFASGSAVASESGDVDAALSASNFTVAGPVGVVAGVSTTYSNAYYNANGTATAQSGAITNSRYFHFTLSAKPGYTLDVDSFTLDFGGNSTAAAGWTANLVVQSSVGGFGEGKPTLAISPSDYRTIPSSGSTSPTANLSAKAVDVSSAAFDDLSSVTFRLQFFYTGGSDANNYSFRFDNVSVATTVVPEPVSAAGFALMGLVGRRRRRST